MKEKVNVFVIKDREMDDIPSNQKDFMSYWQKIFDEVPEQYTDSVVIEIEGRDSYGSGYIECSVYYVRDETDEEENKRNARIEYDEKRRNQRKTEEYLRLQKELGL